VLLRLFSNDSEEKILTVFGEIQPATTTFIAYVFNAFPLSLTSIQKSPRNPHMPMGIPRRPIPIHTGIAIPTAGSPRRFPLSLRLARPPPPPQPTLCCGSSPSQIKGGVTIVRTPSVRLARLASQCRSVGFRRISRSITAVASTHRSAQHTRHRSKNAACSSHRVIAAARQVIVYTPQTPARPPAAQQNNALELLPDKECRRMYLRLVSN